MKRMLFTLSIFLITLTSVIEVSADHEEVTLENVGSHFLDEITIDYTDLDLTGDEIELIKKYHNETIDFGLYELPGHYIDHNGIELGANYYIKLQLEKVFGVNLNIVTDDFSVFMDRYFAGEFDIVPGLHKTEERESFFHYEDAIYNAEIFLYSNEYIHIKNINNLDGKTIAKSTNMEPFPEGYIEQLISYGIDITVVDYDVINDAIADLGTSVDFIVHTKNASLIKNGLEFFDATVLFGGLPLYFTSQKNTEMKSLINIFSKAYETELSSNLEKYRQKVNYLLFQDGYYFTKEQNDFIASSLSDPVKVQSASKWIPYLYEDEDGTLTGYGYDMFTTLSKNIGLNYTFEFDKNYSWLELLDDLGKDGNEIKYDLGILDSMTDYDGDYITYGNPIFTEEVYVVGLVDADDIVDFYDLNDYEIGVIPFYAATTYLERNLTSKEFKEYPTLDSLVTALHNGEIDYFALIKSEYDGLYYINKNYDIVPFYAIREDFHVAMIYPSNGSNTEVLKRIYNIAFELSDTSDVSQDYFRLQADLNDVVQRRVVTTILISLGAVISLSGLLIWIYIHTLRKNLYNDPLTKLLNRRALFNMFEDLEYEYLYYIDFDDFKYVNDTYGHIIGDRVLEIICARMKKDYDGKLFRIGGDEFILLSNKKFKEYELNNEDNNKVIIDNIKLVISKSIGAIDIANWPHSNIDELITLADCAMYYAKERGKNRLVYVTSDLAKNCSKNKAQFRQKNRVAKRGDLNA